MEIRKGNQGGRIGRSEKEKGRGKERKKQGRKKGIEIKKKVEDMARRR